MVEISVKSFKTKKKEKILKTKKPCFACPPALLAPACIVPLPPFFI
jgi:hypothetical protein